MMQDTEEVLVKLNLTSEMIRQLQEVGINEGYTNLSLWVEDRIIEWLDEYT